MSEIIYDNLGVLSLNTEEADKVTKLNLCLGMSNVRYPALQMSIRFCCLVFKTAIVKLL